MFNNVWFYILLYVGLGAAVTVADAKIYMKMRANLDEIDWGVAYRFDDEALITVDSKVLKWIYVIAAYALWPVTLTYNAVKRTIIYRRIIKEEVEKKIWDLKFEKIQKEWSAQ